MKRFGTGAQSFPLTTGSSNAPTLTLGEQTTFFLNTVPDRCPTGPLAYTLPYLLMTISGTVVQSGTGGTKIGWDDLPGLLINNLGWEGAFFGTPVSSNWVFGRNWAVSGFVTNGYRHAMRQRPPIPAAAGTYPFRLTIAIPAASLMMGSNMAETSQLALLFKNSEFTLTMAPATVLAGYSTGATFGTLTARLSAVCYPTTDLILGTPVETVLHTVPAAAGSNQITVVGFGRNTALTGVEKKGGVLFLGALTDQGLQQGVFSLEDVTQVAMPWRGQIQQKHIEALMAPALMALPNNRSQTLPTAISGGDAEFANFPYTMVNNDFTPAATMDFVGARALELVYPDNDVQLADLQTASEDKDIYLDVNPAFSAGSHQILGIYARQWKEDMVKAWVAEVTDGGKGGLASYVLGKDWAKADIGVRLPTGRHVTTGDDTSYLAWQLSQAVQAA